MIDFDIETDWLVENLQNSHEGSLGALLMNFK